MATREATRIYKFNNNNHAWNKSETKPWSTIKKSQNFMNMTVGFYHPLGMFVWSRMIWLQNIFQILKCNLIEFPSFKKSDMNNNIYKLSSKVPSMEYQFLQKTKKKFKVLRRSSFLIFLGFWFVNWEELDEKENAKYK